MPSFNMEAIKNISIFEFAEKRGYELKRIKDDYFKIDKMGGTYITPSKNMFNSFAQKTGGGIIQFVMFTEGLTNKEAMHLLNDEYLAGNLKPIDVSKHEKNQNSIIEKKEKAFILPPKNSDNKEIINYLVNYRKIDKEFVDKAINENKIYQKQKDRNLIYLVVNSKNEITGAEWINTDQDGQYKGRKGFVAGSKINEDCAFEFKGTSNKLYLFESPTDLMSYMTLEKLKGNYDNIKNDTFIANWSIANDKIVKNYIQNNKNITEVYICYDNDIDGTIIKNGQIIPYNHGQEKAKELVKELTESFVKDCSIICPTEKDYNDDLKKYFDTIKKEETYNKESKLNIEKIEEKNINDKGIDELEKELENLNKKLKEKKFDLDYSDSPQQSNQYRRDIKNIEKKITSIENVLNEKKTELKLEKKNSDKKEKEMIDDFLELKTKEVIIEKEETIKLKAIEVNKEIVLLEKQKQEQLNKINELENELNKLRNSYTITVNKMLELKDKQHNEIIKNSARFMLSAGMSIALVNEATKININELEKIHKEIIEDRIISSGTIEVPNLNMYLPNINIDKVEDVVLQQKMN